MNQKNLTAAIATPSHTKLSWANDFCDNYYISINFVMLLAHYAIGSG